MLIGLCALTGVVSPARSKGLAGRMRDDAGRLPDRIAHVWNNFHDRLEPGAAIASVPNDSVGLDFLEAHAVLEPRSEMSRRLWKYPEDDGCGA